MQGDHHGFTMVLLLNINFTLTRIEIIIILFSAHAQAVREVQVDGARGFQDP